MLGGRAILSIFWYPNDDNFIKMIVHYILNIFGHEYYYENGNYIMSGIEIWYWNKAKFDVTTNPQINSHTPTRRKH